MYVRQARQFLRNSIAGFDERKYGFASVVDLLRAAGKEGVLRIERDRQGAVRVFPGANFVKRPSEAPLDLDETFDVEVPPERVDPEPAHDRQILDAYVEAPPAADVTPIDEAPTKKPARKRKSATPRTAKAKAEQPVKTRGRKRAVASDVTVE
jgi:hypothetical protein